MLGSVGRIVVDIIVTTCTIVDQIMQQRINIPILAKLQNQNTTR